MWITVAQVQVEYHDVWRNLVQGGDGLVLGLRRPDRLHPGDLIQEFSKDPVQPEYVERLPRMPDAPALPGAGTASTAAAKPEYSSADEVLAEKSMFNTAAVARWEAAKEANARESSFMRNGGRGMARDYLARHSMASS